MGPQGPAGVQGIPGPTGPDGTQRIYRWATFQTYNEGSAWAAGNDPLMFGGVAPSNWTDASATAAAISSNKDTQRALFVNKAYPGRNATVYSGSESYYSSTNGRIIAALFRVRNNTTTSIGWTPIIYYSCFSNWNEVASIALNGVNVLNPVCDGNVQRGQVNMSIPPNRTSTVIFISTTGRAFSIGNNIHVRASVLAFANDSLALPTGLEFVDDLDSATGDYSQ